MAIQDTVGEQTKAKETKEQKFRRIAARRTRLVLRYVRLLGNTANPQNYEFSAKDVDAIFTAVRDAVTDTEAKFRRVDEQKFDL